MTTLTEKVQAERIPADQVAELINTGYAIPITHNNINMVYYKQRSYYYNGEEYVVVDDCTKK